MSTNWRTKLIHSERKVPEGFRSLATPVFRGSTTLFRRASAIVDTWNHDDVPYSYGSYGTPTTLELAARMSQETIAAQDMLTCFAQWQGRKPVSVAADTT